MKPSNLDPSKAARALTDIPFRPQLDVRICQFNSFQIFGLTVKEATYTLQIFQSYFNFTPDQSYDGSFSLPNSSELLIADPVTRWRASEKYKTLHTYAAQQLGNYVGNIYNLVIFNVF